MEVTPHKNETSRLTTTVFPGISLFYLRYKKDCVVLITVQRYCFSMTCANFCVCYKTCFANFDKFFSFCNQKRLFLA